MLTFVLIPGLLSDRLVWTDLAKALTAKGAVHHAELGRYSSIIKMAEGVLAETEGDLIAIGHSMGARVALEMARQAPTRVRALVLADTGMYPLKPGEAEQRHKKIQLGYESMEQLADLWLPPMVSEKHHDKPLMGQLREMVLRMTPEQHERHLIALMDRPDASRYVEEINCPVLLIVGAEDQWSPIHQHEEIAAVLPHATLEIMRDAGHFAPFEQPAAVTNTITNWAETLPS